MNWQKMKQPKRTDKLQSVSNVLNFNSDNTLFKISNLSNLASCKTGYIFNTLLNRYTSFHKTNNIHDEKRNFEC